MLFLFMLSRPLLKIFNQFSLGISLLLELSVTLVGTLRLREMAPALGVMTRAKLLY